MKLIDADALSKALGDRVDAINENIRKGATLPNIAWFSGMAIAESIIEAQPTVDAVPVIRCKDCKWYSANTGYHWGRCENYRPFPFDETDYCSRAERKEE